MYDGGVDLPPHTVQLLCGKKTTTFFEGRRLGKVIDGGNFRAMRGEAKKR